MHPVPILAAILLALGAVEGLAYWWMHPAPSHHEELVLVYRPVGLDRRAGRDLANGADRERNAEDRGQGSGVRGQEKAPPHAQSPSSTFDVGSSKFDVASSPIQHSTSNIQHSTTTPLPGIYEKAAPMLRCSSGQVLHCKIDDTLGLHLAFFEWDGTDTGSVLEAFRHMPEACMGAIGMKLVERAPPRSYTVGRDPARSAHLSPSARDDKDQASEDSGQGSGIGDRGLEMRDPEQTTAQSSSSHQPLTINHQPSTSPSGETLTFDHTVFRDPGSAGGALSPGALVHAFRAVWVSGLSLADARQGLGGDEFDRLRTIRLKSALTRFRPSHARVIQGAVRGAPNADAAWQAFEQFMLADLKMEPR